MKTLVTGSAGFIGFHLSKALLEKGAQVVGVDNLNDYYDVSLKRARNEILEKFPNFRFYRADVSDKAALETVFNENDIEKVCHLAAQA